MSISNPSLTRCVKCLMTTTRPDLAFASGVCSGCIAYRLRDEIDWPQRYETLIGIIESAKPNRDGHKAIVASSGGKDSHALVLKLIELGANPLVVTASTCMLTATGRANIDNLARHATTIEVTPNRRVRAMLNRLGLELVGDIGWPEHVSINAAPWRIARDFGIPLIFYGEAPTTEYAGPLDQIGAEQMTRRWISEYGGQLGLRPNDLIGTEGLTEADMAPYQMPTQEEMEQIKAYFLGAFIPWNSNHNVRDAVAAGMIAELPYEGNWLCGENTDNAQIGLHDNFGWYKFGYGRLCAQISVDIRYGMLTREEAIPIVRAKDGMFPATYMGVHWLDVLKHIGMTRERFIEVAHVFANRDLFDLVPGELPRMKHEVWEASFA